MKENKYKTHNIKLKDRLDFLNQHIFIDTKNPIKTLKFEKPKEDTKQNNIPYMFWLTIMVTILICSSIAFNSFFTTTFDPIVIKLVKFSMSLPSLAENYISDQIHKPYVLTIGEFGNSGIAKEEAIKLLPQLKQIDIKQLPSGLYTFEIDRFSSKEKAYLFAKKLTDKGFNIVHVRYLKD